MGFFSWITQDTERSIANAHSGMGTFPVTMIDDKGNKWTEDNYDGYGEFGGKDFYTLLSEMNGGSSNRDSGINMAFDGNTSGENPKLKYPNLVQFPDSWTYTPDSPTCCPDQGYFYTFDDDFDEEDDDMDDYEEYDEDHTDTSNF